MKNSLVNAFNIERKAKNENYSDYEIFPDKKLLDDFEKGRKDLSEYRKKLNQKLTSKVLVDNKTGEIYEVFYHEQKVSLL